MSCITYGKRRLVRQAIVAAAASVAVPLIALGGATNDPGFVGPGNEYVVSTSGATALGAFTRARNADNSYNRGPFAMGSNSLRIGRTMYDIGTGQFFAMADLGAGLGNEPTTNNDRLVYKYHETGSIAGILELVDSNGLLLQSPGGSAFPPRRPLDPTLTNPLFANGNRYTAPGTGPFGGYSTGANYVNNNINNPTNPQTGQELARIAWSDVRTEQAFAVSGTASVSARPTDPGYGLGRGNVGNTNFQRLRNANVIEGGIEPSTTRLRNETVAVVPFNLVANPGTGLARISQDEGLWLQTTGRLSNGANFNVATRDSGSGTRNQGVSNLGGDPTWGAGERDRVVPQTRPDGSLVSPFNAEDPDGQTVSVHPGDEADPRLSLFGTTASADLINESRVSPLVRFADKTSGSTGIRPTVQASRMGAGGVLSSGDTSTNAISATANAPIRALAIDFSNGEGFVQATAKNVTDGKYRVWSQAQAVTVAPYANPEANDTAGTTGRPILNDTNDEAAIAGGTNIGTHRKFLDNIRNSVATLSAAPTNITPVDAIINAGFIPPQIMGVTKQFDGSTQNTRTRSTVDPDGAGPQRSEQDIWDIVTAPGGILANPLNWANPSTHNGNLAGSGVKYDIYHATNALATQSTNADVSITVTARTNLAGDFNNDTVRDIQDVPRMALAYANSEAYLNTADGAALASTGTFTQRAGTLITVPGSGTVQLGNANLVVLSDLNSDGNIPYHSAAATLKPVDRADVRYFLYGAAIDTSAFNVAANSTLNGQPVALTPEQNRRENGVRLGQLKKNAAIDTFNTTLDGMVGTVANPSTSAPYTQGEIDALKVDKFDVDGDGQRTRHDAKIVDRNVGRNYTVFADVLSSSDNLVAAELQDNLTITHLLDGGTSDFKMIRDALGSSLLDGDADFDGTVEIDDLRSLALHWQTSVDQWSEADFDFNGLVNELDLGLLAQNWDGSAAGLGSLVGALGLPPSAVPEPGLLGLFSLGAVMMIRRRRSR